MNLKVALLLLLVFASTVTATAVALSISAPVASQNPRSMAVFRKFQVKPLEGDPILAPTPPH